MNKWKLLIKHNWLASIVALAILVTCLSLLYYKHPSSPYFKHDIYVLRYEQIGTLSPGNLVRVNGLPRGEISKVELTEDAVYVTIKVTKGTKIQRNSSFRLINSGLMGEREVAILLGQSEDFLVDGDTIVGYYDEGTSGLSKKLAEIFSDLEESLDKTKASIDSLITGSNGKRIARVQQKGVKLLGDIESLINSNLEEGKKRVDDLSTTLETLKQLLDKSENRLDGSVKKAEALLARVDEVLGQAKKVYEELDNVSKKVDKTIEDYEDVVKIMDNLSKNVEEFSKDLKKNGLKVNIDIF